MKKFFGHLKTIIKHKWFVFYYSCKVGIPFRGLVHDMSKFSLTELKESTKFYNGLVSPIRTCKEINGYSLAWQHHKGHNPHHYEYWVDTLDSGATTICMPYKYTLEMVCDYLAAGRTYIGKYFTFEDEMEWWINERNYVKAMHPVQIEFLDSIFLFLKEFKVFPKKKNLKLTYESIKEKYPLKVLIKNI